MTIEHKDAIDQLNGPDNSVPLEDQDVELDSAVDQAGDLDGAFGSDETAKVADSQDGEEIPVAGIHTDPVDSFHCGECGSEINVEGLPSFSEVTCHGCGASASVPARLSNFLLLRLLGTGGMGGVYYARDEALGRFVAIKVMLKSLGNDPVFIETFRKEAQAVAKLNHPNIAQIYSFGQEKGQPYIVMELVSGERVDAMMENPDGLRPALVMKIGLEIAQGLSAADEAGLVHGDIKPENILLDTKGQAKLVDFGLATVAHQAAGEGIWGTPYYIAPEKIRRQKVDARSDIYSLGATLFHMLTGTPPFEGATPVAVVKARLELPPPDPQELIPDLPEIVSATIKRMLAVDRTERYPNYLSLISDLRKAVKELGAVEAVKTSRFNSSKTIRFKNKKGGGSSPLPASPSETTQTEEASVGVKSKKLVIRKGGDGTSKFKVSSGSSANAGKKGSKGIGAARIMPSPEEIAARKARNRRRGQRVLVTFILILLLAGGVVAGAYIRMLREEEMKRRAEVFALHNAWKSAADLYLSISNTVDRVRVFAASGDPVEEEVQASVERITGSRMEIAPPPPVDGGDEAPPAEAGEVGNTEEPEESEPVVEPTQEPEVPAHPIEAPARQALEQLQKLFLLRQQSEEVLETTIVLRDKILAESLSGPASAEVTQLEALEEEVKHILADTKNAKDEAIRQAGQVKLIRTTFDRQAAARLAAEEEAERRRKEAERLEQERLEYEARVATELQQAEGDRLNVKGLFDSNSFEEALATLTQNKDNYTTKEGKAAIQVVIDRYTYLVRMKEALIEIIPAEPFPWGWGSGSMARDIEHADDRGIHIKGIPNPVPWSEVTTDQMLKIVDYYQSSRTMHPRLMRNMVLGAAIYCDKFGPAGRERARSYANRALDLRLPREEFTRLLENGWR